MKTRLATTILMLLLSAGAAGACFGPKLYLGTPGGARSDALTALVTLYVKEKTGTEIVTVPLEGRDPVAEIAGERIDLSLTDGAPGGFTVLLDFGGRFRLLSGDRPLTDLQFTTVAPALRKLGGLLREPHIEELLRQMEGGTSAMAAAREFLMAEGWI